MGDSIVTGVPQGYPNSSLDDARMARMARLEATSWIVHVQFNANLVVIQ
jgi:hypothetical protein